MTATGGDAPSDVLAAALAYAARGWRVFPCDPETKRPLVWPDKDADGKAIPRSGWLKKATTDAATIREWWRRWPAAMIGLPQGTASDGYTGCFVLDFDPRVDEDTGEVYDLARLKAETEALIGAELPVTATAVTPSGGVHLYFEQPDDPGSASGTGGEPIRNRGSLPAHVDVRGAGGYVVAPPSVRADGVAYRWRRAPDETPPQPAPAALLTVLRAPKGSNPPLADAPSPASARPAAGDSGRRSAAVEKYAATVFNNQVARVCDAGEGTRNNTLNEAAYILGTYVGADALSESVVVAALEDAAKAWPNFPKSQGTIRSGLEAGKAAPADLSDVGTHAARARGGDGLKPAHSGSPGGKPPSEGHGGETAELDLARLPLTDLGNAERFVAREGDNFVHNQALGWLAWDGRRWARDGAEALLAKAIYRTVRAIAGEADALVDAGKDFPVEETAKKVVFMSDKIRGWARASEALSRISAIRTLVAPMLRVETSVFDADPWVINVMNGTLEVRRREEGDYIQLRPHARTDYITKLAPVVYDPEAGCPKYDEAVAFYQPDSNMRAFLHRWGGLSLTGDTSQQKMAFWYGMGSNGKSTVIDVWAHVAGDYATTLPVETLLDQGRHRKGGDATPDLAALPGVRLLRVAEPQKGAKFDEALIKSLTGGEPIMARHLHGEFFEFRPCFKITMSGNLKPEVKGTDDGIWRRLRLVPWEVTVPEEMKRESFLEELKAESSGILNRLLDGLRMLLDEGLDEPETVRQATSEFREESDPLGRFLKLCTAPDPDGRVQSSALYAVFCAWARSVGEREWSQTGFSRAMVDRGYKSIHSNQRWFLGLQLVKSEYDFVSPVNRADGGDMD